MSPSLRLLFLLLLLFAPLSSRADPAPTLAGTWKINPALSSDLTPWRDLTVTLSHSGDTVTLHRAFSSGRRQFDETITLDLSLELNLVPVAWWPDNRHLGAYAGGDKTKRIRATWLDQGRILRLSTDLTLSTQQGLREVNILSDYKVSANGAQLTLTELRSTRNRPVVYVFTRAN
ncbi:MAG: hypothetical protein Q8J74_02820 [Candidatus Didemnitutus sp.]|nr:hypothetical protein [Candidatus Didemnitutus sp.]